jgi:hypothetical protein
VLLAATIAAGVSKLIAFMLFIFFISLLGCHFSINGVELLNDFSELYPNYTIIKIFCIQLIRFNFKLFMGFSRKKFVFFEDFNLAKKRGGRTQIYLLTDINGERGCADQDLSITVRVRMTIWVTFACSIFTITVAWPVVSFCSVKTALVAFVTTFPSPSITVVIIGVIDVTL